ncbi:MAG: hypothetical protein EOO87_08165 [Pedobacter sp.]|nr:MAG: hypothetical protein EOO87_08165 [Pedobacter sp.]
MPQIKSEVDKICPVDREGWREWLTENHCLKESVWLIYYKKKSNLYSMSWGDAVEEALCFGWIDSVRKTLDDERFLQLFTRRKPKGTWSKINKQKIEQLIQTGLMTEAGLAVISRAKENGSWDILNEVEDLKIPDDLNNALKKDVIAESFFNSLSKSVKKAMLQWIIFAKRSETREKRINEIAELAAKNQKPKQF